MKEKTIINMIRFCSVVVLVVASAFIKSIFLIIIACFLVGYILGDDK